MEFHAEDTFQIAGRGTVHVVRCPGDCPREKLADMIGREATIDGTVYTVRGIERFAVPLIRAGMPIGLMVEPKEQ